jgi:hypothetical protein
MLSDKNATGNQGQGAHTGMLPGKSGDQAGEETPAHACVHFGKDKRTFHRSWFLVKLRHNIRKIKD